MEVWHVLPVGKRYRGPFLVSHIQEVGYRDAYVP